MAFRFPFISIPTVGPVVSLAGRRSRPRPIIPIVAFAPKKSSNPLLGFAGFLQFFDTTFWGALEEVELVPNGLLQSQPPSIVVP